MKVTYGSSSIVESLSQSVLTIGNFDGVHRGHRKLLEEVRSAAQKYRVPSVVYTFDPHPMEILAPGKPFFRLFETSDQEHQLEKLQIDYFVIEKFTKKFASMSPEDFLEKHLFSVFKPLHIVVGYDFAFGAKKEGTITDLKEFAKTRDCTVSVVEPVKWRGQIISSSLIRQLVISGEIKNCNDLLERPYYLEGEVEKGDQRGRLLGFPTANMSVQSDLHPKPGVYVSRLSVDGKSYSAISNIGKRPTFFEDGESQCFLETHVFDFHQDIYGRRVQVELLEYVRGEKKFNGVEELKEQIELDCQKAHEVHSEMAGHWR